MKVFSCSVLILSLFKWFCVLSFDINLNLPTEEIVKNYQSLMNQTVEETFNLEILEKKVNQIKSHNELYEAGKVTHQLGLNHLSALSEFEFQKMLGYKPDATSMTRGIQDTLLGIIGFVFGLLSSLYFQSTCPKIPKDNTTVDLRTYDCWGKVLDQGKCGSCYAFSALQVLSFLECVQCNGITSKYLSEQAIVDCSADEGNQGCNGGLMEYAIDYVIKVPGINLEEDYPYEAVQGECRSKIDKVQYKNVTSYTSVKQCETEMMKYLDQKISLCVAIKVADTFQDYKGGVYKQNCATSPTQLNHAVVLAGYGVCNETGLPYWLIKNSWSTKWGEGGYIRILRGSCCLGICIKAGFPVFGCDSK